jgi:RNA polymerase sigma-70 factor (ECF subfamily)
MITHRMIGPVMLSSGVPQPQKQPTFSLDIPHGAGCFPTTHWSVVLASGSTQSLDAAAALEHLCRMYWYPLYVYIRRRGYDMHTAQDLVQSFFARLLAKDYFKHADRTRGKFRAFLLTSLQRFLADEWDHAHRLKRGGGSDPISLDGLTAEERYKLEPIDSVDAVRLFDRRWATTLLQVVLQRLAEEQGARGRASQFDDLRQYLVAEGEPESYEKVAQRLGLTVTGTRMAVSRLRERYREMLQEEILRTVASAEDAEEEYRSLMAVLTD